MSDYYKVDFKIQPFSDDAADLLAAFLADAGFDSFESDSSAARLSGYVAADLFRKEAVEEMISSFPMDVSISFRSTLIPHQDWNEEWEKNYFKPLVLADGRCVVHSSFHTDFPSAEIEIIVDPKMAFGTGNHATTSMMVNFLFNLDIKGKRILDMGTGTGILAIIAMKLGASHAMGIEIDPAAYENALENVTLNHTDVLLLQGDASLLKGLDKVDFFLANINRNIILNDLADYVDTMLPGATILLSGFLEEDVPALSAALESFGLRVMEVTTSSPVSSDSFGTWAAIRAEKP